MVKQKGGKATGKLQLGMTAIGLLIAAGPAAHADPKTGAILSEKPK
jgi:hypothetical protein